MSVIRSEFEQLLDRMLAIGESKPEDYWKLRGDMEKVGMQTAYLHVLDGIVFLHSWTAWQAYFQKVEDDK
jgi:hypothetical protein